MYKRDWNISRQKAKATNGHKATGANLEGVPTGQT